MEEKSDLVTFPLNKTKTKQKMHIMLLSYQELFNFLTWYWVKKAFFIFNWIYVLEKRQTFLFRFTDFQYKINAELYWVPAVGYRTKSKTKVLDFPLICLLFVECKIISIWGDDIFKWINSIHCFDTLYLNEKKKHSILVSTKVFERCQYLTQWHTVEKYIQIYLLLFTQWTQIHIYYSL